MCYVLTRFVCIFISLRLDFFQFWYFLVTLICELDVNCTNANNSLWNDLQNDLHSNIEDGLSAKDCLWIAKTANIARVRHLLSKKIHLLSVFFIQNNINVLSLSIAL